MRTLSAVLALLLALQPAPASAQALNDAADMAGSASMGDRRFDGALGSRHAGDGVLASETLPSKKTLEPPVPGKKEARLEPPNPYKPKTGDLNGGSARRGQVIGALAGGAVGASAGAIVGWAIFGSLFGILGLAVLGAVAFGAIGQDAGRHCGADPTCS